MSDHSLRAYDSILDLLPDADNPTPIVALQRITGFQHARVYAKLEWYNPFGAVKDRVAANLIGDAEERGEHLENLVEPTSGNTGIGLAMVSNARDYGFSATLSKAIPLEKRTALRLFGTDLVELDDDLCPMPGQPEGAMAKAEELGQRPGWRELNQYANPANPEAHYKTTGPEIWRQTQGTVTHLVAALGTCGTITGTGRYLKEQNPDVQVIGVHPTQGHDIPGVRSLRALALTDFFVPDEYDAVLEVGDDEAYGVCQRLHLEESLIAGPSCGLALAGALRAVPDEPGVVAVVIFPDNAWKYLSSFRKHLPALFPAEEPVAIPPANPFAEHLEAAFALAKTGPDRDRRRRGLRAAGRRRHPGRRPQPRRGRPGCDPDGPEAAAARVERREPGGPPHRQGHSPAHHLRGGNPFAVRVAAVEGAGLHGRPQRRRWHGLLGGRGPADLGAGHPRWRRPARATLQIQVGPLRHHIRLRNPLQSSDR